MCCIQAWRVSIAWTVDNNNATLDNIVAYTGITHCNQLIQALSYTILQWFYFRFPNLHEPNISCQARYSIQSQGCGFCHCGILQLSRKVFHQMHSCSPKLLKTKKVQYFTKPQKSFPTCVISGSTILYVVQPMEPITSFPF